MRGLAEAILQQKEPEGERLRQKGHKLPSNLIEGSKLFSNLPQLRQRREAGEKMKKKIGPLLFVLCLTHKGLHATLCQYLHSITPKPAFKLTKNQMNISLKEKK